MAVAEASNVSVLLARELTTEETALVERRLEDVERMIIRKIPDLLEQIADEQIAEADVRQIEAEAVYRVVRNPEGLRSETDGHYGYERSPEAADNSLRILPEEWAVLGIRTRRMFGISPGIGGVRL